MKQRQSLYNDIADEYGTPCYVYDKQIIENNFKEFAGNKIYYALKANSNLSIAKLFSQLGCGFDIVSGGELEIALKAGAKPSDIVFSGVGKSKNELSRAIDLEIGSIHIESEAELYRIHNIAKVLGKIANIAFRVNPDITPDTHPYITTAGKKNKFGIEYSQAINMYQQAKQLSNLNICGIAFHIGSQILSIEPFIQALNQILELVKILKGMNIDINYIDVGGGLGINYKNDNPPKIRDYINKILELSKPYNLDVHFAPGRALVGNAGVLLTKVEYIKTSDVNFAIVDCGMNDLMRPSLYNSYHNISVISNQADVSKTYYIVGPVCESGDFLAKDRELALQENSLLAIHDCGAYGFSMSSNYNSRPRPAEVMINDNKFDLIRAREEIN